MPEPKRVIIDTDPGIDDAAAIFMALASPELQIEAFTSTFGNADIETCTQNTLRLLEAVRRCGYAGPIYPVSRPHAQIDGLPCVASVAA